MSMPLDPLSTLQKQLVVEAPIERAFDVFSSRMTTWWPRRFSVGATPFVECVLEARVDGRWFERAADGVECPWGRVLVREPPTRLVLAWQLDATFKDDPTLITEVDVRFTALGPTSTRVDLEHRHLARFGDLAAKVGPLMDQGWGGLRRRGTRPGRRSHAVSAASHRGGYDKHR